MSGHHPWPPPGHNDPPGMAEIARQTASDLNEWMKEHPSVENEDKAREAKLYIDRAKLGLKDLEDERDSKVRPLNERVEAINDSYRGPRNLLKGILDELQSRLSDFMRAETAKRQAVADQARRAAEEAARAAREAERIEQERLDNARRGELGVDILGATEFADQQFAAFEKAERQAALAEKETNVKVGGGISRAISLRQKETLAVANWSDALSVLGVTAQIEQAILTAARAYRKLHNKLPPGIVSKIDTTL